MKENSENIDDLNGIIEVRYGDEIYKTWTVKLTRPYIFKFLKEKYPYSLVVREINKIDYIIIDNKLNDIIPIEIQKTPISGNIRKFAHTMFEQSIRKQLEDNIENYGKCWFFFDSEYLRYLQSRNIGSSISINMTWLVKLMKENTLKVFVIRYDNTIKELTTKDFDFLKNMSQTCSIGYKNDERVLNRNKLKILQNVINGYNFTQEEIIKFESNFDNQSINKINSSREYFQSSNNESCKLYGYIMESISNLSTINNILSCSIKDKSKRTIYAVTLGIFHQNDFYGLDKHARIQFVNKFNIAQYFPGYLRNKEMWDYCKEKKRIFTIDEFRGIVEGREHCLKLIKNQSKSLADYD